MKQVTLLITTFGLTGHAVAGSGNDNFNSKTRESRPSPSSARFLRPFTDIPTVDTRPFTDIPTADSRPFTDIPTVDSRPFTDIPTVIFSPTYEPTIAPSVSNPPTGECGSLVDDFTIIGVGRCLDSEDVFHNLIRFDDITSGTDCSQECECIAGFLTLQGFDFNSSSNQCRCRVDEDNAGNALFNTMNACGANGFNNGNVGTGKVISADGTGNFCCFRYDLTSSAPSSVPSPSPSALPSSIPTAKPSLQPSEECGPEIDDFSKMGRGRCLDSDDAVHNLIRFDSVTSGTECSQECECVAGYLTLQGFDYNSSSNQCRCRVDEDNTGGVLATVKDDCSANGFNDSLGGAGKVISANGNSAFCCFRYDLTSSVPSASPTVSLQPTGECGSIIDDYTNIGKGKCLDGDDIVHNLIRFDGVTTGTACATKCGCVAGFLTLQGFDLDSATSECRCRVDEDNTGNALATARTNCGAQGQNANNGGSGKVISSNGDDDFCCFRYDLTTSAPSTSSAPSVSLMPSMSSSPSYIPSSSPAPTAVPTALPSISNAPTPRLLKTGKPCTQGTDCRSGCCGDVPNDGKGKVCVKLNDSNNNTCPYPDE